MGDTNRAANSDQLSTPTFLRPVKCDIETSGYDRLASALTAAVLVCGFVFAALALALLSEPMIPYTKARPEVTIKPKLLIEPSANAEVAVEQVGGGQWSPMTSTSLDERTLDNVTDAISQTRLLIQATSFGEGQVTGDGFGDREGPERGHGGGPDGDGGGGVDWRLGFEISSLDHYVAQLNSLGIELAMVSRASNDIWRVKDLGGTNRIELTGRAAERETFFFVPSHPRLRQWNRQLTSGSGIAPAEILFVHFCPSELVSEMMTQVESSLEVGRKIDQVATVRFRVVQNSAGSFELAVDELVYDEL